VRGVDSPKLVAMVCTCEGCAQSLLTPFDGVQIATSSATNSPHARGPHPPAISSARGPRTHCRVRLSRTHRAATFEMAMAWPGGRFAVGQQVYVRDAQHGWSPATVTVNSAPDTVRRLRPPMWECERAPRDAWGGYKYSAYSGFTASGKPTSCCDPAGLQVTAERGGKGAAGVDTKTLHRGGFGELHCTAHHAVGSLPSPLRSPLHCLGSSNGSRQGGGTPLFGLRAMGIL
jgi:hypothetical protein